MKSTPDYRGMFLRGIGGNAAGLGEYQGDAIRNITGKFSTTLHSGLMDAYTEGCVYFKQTYSTGDDGTFNSGETLIYAIDASRVVPTANENRPVNKAVRYFIKAR